jgi:hypothetical protein
MTATRRLTAILAADVAGSSQLLKPDKQEILITKLPAADLVALSAVLLFGLASA